MTGAGSGVESYARELTRIADEIEEVYTADPSDDNTATEKILLSACTPAIRWLHGRVAASSLPSVFTQLCGRLQGNLEEYLLDSIKHLDNGDPDEALELLGADAFAGNGKGKETTLAKLISGKLTEINLDKDFVHVIAMHLDPHAKTFDSMIDVFLDAERLAMHRTFVSRGLHALGKSVDATCSYGALLDEWGPVLVSAKQAGPAMARDVAEHMLTLYNNVMRAQQRTVETCLSKGTPWEAHFFNRNLQAFDVFDKFVKQAKLMGGLQRAFLHTFQAMVPAAAAQPGGKQRGGRQQAQPGASQPGRQQAQPGAGQPGQGLGQPRKAGKAGALGSRSGQVANVHEGPLKGCVAHATGSQILLHEAACRTLISTFKDNKGNLLPADSCVLVCFAQGAPTFETPAKDFTLQHAEMYCEHGHPAGDARHRGWHHRVKLVAALEDGVHCFTRADSTVLTASGGASGGRPANPGDGKRRKARGSGNRRQAAQ